MVIAALIPASDSPVISVVTFPRLRGVDPWARLPRGARARRLVIEVWVPASSTKTKRAGSNSRAPATQPLGLLRRARRR